MAILLKLSPDYTTYIVPPRAAVDELPPETSEKSDAPPVPEELPVLEDPPTSEKSAFGFGLSLENVIATPRFD